ncbi:hypothetical protein [Sorangium sp. So ce861]|uniref:hypothetical protein n=1 Tax=Sorangium sp. So ce861 TaxID=3133323 RepID=UPI003F645E4E
MHYDGQSWQAVTDSGTSASLSGVWGSAPGDVFAVGWGGTIVHYDGISWLEVNSTTYKSLSSIWGHAGTSFIVGENGTIFRHIRSGTKRNHSTRTRQ